VLTLIWRADEGADVLQALAGEFGAIAVLEVAPREGAPAIRVLVRAVKGGAGAPTYRPALMLNDAQGRPTAAAQAVLRGGQKLTLAEDGAGYK
jgi:tRNA1(Val) A37 N6-methylase TrmN6